MPVTMASSSVEPFTVTWKPLLVSTLLALDSVMCSTLGTLTCCLPRDTQMVTDVPSSTVLPEPGSRRVTEPESTESEYSFSTLTVPMPALLSCSITESFDCPTRLSGILVMPDEIYNVMIVPLVCLEFAAGSVLTTLSFSTVPLSTVLTLPTLKPADSRTDLASS